MGKKGLAVFVFGLLSAAFLLFQWREAGAACVPECDYSSWSCGSCGYGCVKTCTRQKCCLTMSCGYSCTTQTSTQSCSYTTCTSCTCSGLRECCDCYGNCVPSRCAPPAGCATPTPTPTPTPICGLKGDCVTDADCPNDPTDGDTCLITKNPGECWCTKETDPTSYVCEPYRDPQVVDGVCYQQWKCCKPSQEVCLESFYQIRHDCVGGSATPSPTSAPSPSCSVSLSPSAATVAVGSGVSLVASVVPSDGTVDYVSFSSSDSSVASVDPASDPTAGYSTAATGVAAGGATVTARAAMGGAVRCSDSSTVSVVPAGPWWRVRDGDVAANGSLVSLIPFGCALPACDPRFGLDGDGGFPGIPGFVGSLNVGTAGSVSSTGWAAEGAPTPRKTYSYSHFVRQIPSDVEITTIASSAIEGSLFESGGVLSHGARWYRYDGSSGLDLSVSGDMNLGPRKVVLLVANADLYVGGKINLADGEGFFAAIVGRDADGNKGNIVVGSSVGGTADGVPELEGLFVADSEVLTGSGNMQLHVRGSVAGLSGIVLQRDLDDDSRTPAELFEYAPDLIMNVPSSLRTSGYSWREVAP